MTVDGFNFVRSPRVQLYPRKAVGMAPGEAAAGFVPDLATGTAHGVAASAMVVPHLRPWMFNPEQTHPWVIDALGLKEQPIRFQKEKKGS